MEDTINNYKDKIVEHKQLQNINLLKSEPIQVN